MDEENPEERLLYSSRHGDVDSVCDLLQQRSADKITLNIDCEGRSTLFLEYTIVTKRLRPVKHHL